MIKLLVIGDMNVRGVTMPRLLSLERLPEKHSVTVILRNKYPSTFDVEWCDVVFFLRATNTQDLQFLKTCKTLGKKIWIDSDDDLLNIPLDHGNYFDLNSTSIKEAYKEIHKIADHVTFSTKQMRDTHIDLVKECSIIPCAYPDERIKEYLKPAPSNKIVLWRGTATHEKSLLEFTPAVLKVAKENPDWVFMFIGCKPWTIIEKLKNLWEVHPFMDVDDLLIFINQRRPAVNMVIRTDNLFTRARSSISYMEATFGGAVTVAPSWGDWQKPGIVNYKNKNDFVAKMNATMQGFNKKGNSAKVAKAAGYIKKYLTWSAVNKTQLEILETLCSTR